MEAIMKTLKALKRVRLGSAKKLTKANLTLGMSEFGNFTYSLSMN
jgi:hypothetical protein